MIGQMQQVTNCYNGVQVILNEFRKIDPDYEPLVSYQKDNKDDNGYRDYISTIFLRSKSENEKFFLSVKLFLSTS